MSTYPVTIFVHSDGTYVSAADTDQHHVSVRYKRVRTVNGRLCLSAGMWDVSQMKYRPFLEAVVEASKECETMEQKGFTLPTYNKPLISDSEFKEYLDQHPIGEKGGKALRLVAVEGFDFTNAARISGMNKPETNGRKQVKRLYKTLIKRREAGISELTMMNGE